MLVVVVGFFFYQLTYWFSLLSILFAHWLLEFVVAESEALGKYPDIVMYGSNSLARKEIASYLFCSAT